jgi:AcrR family transcriptional regulator
MEVVAARGFGATVEEIALVSGVSPRTIFRHYQTHDRLIAATVMDMFEACGLPRLVEDVEAWATDITRDIDHLDGWIDYLMLTFHTRSAEIFGAAFWDISAPHANASEALSEVDALRRDYRFRAMSYVVDFAWRTAGGVGEPPEELLLVFALNLSVFSTQALMVDFDHTPEQIGALTADIMKMSLWNAVRAQQRPDGDFVGSGR